MRRDLFLSIFAIWLAATAQFVGAGAPAAQQRLVPPPDTTPPPIAAVAVPSDTATRHQTHSIFLPFSADRRAVLEADARIYGEFWGETRTDYRLRCDSWNKNRGDPGVCDNLNNLEVIVVGYTSFSWFGEYGITVETSITDTTVTHTWTRDGVVTTQTQQDWMISFAKSFYVDFSATIDIAAKTASATGVWGYKNLTHDDARDQYVVDDRDEEIPKPFTNIDAMMVPVTVTAGNVGSWTPPPTPPATSAPTLTTSTAGAARVSGPVITQAAMAVMAVAAVGGAVVNLL